MVPRGMKEVLLTVGILLALSHVTKSAQDDTTVQPTTVQEDDDDPMSASEVLDFILDKPEYFAMIGMGILIILLTVTAVVVICMYSGRNKNEKN